MLKYLSKALGATTRLIVGESNPELVARTRAVDEVMDIRHGLKKADAYTTDVDAALLIELDLIMGREGSKSTELTAEQGIALAVVEADVEVEVEVEAEVEAVVEVEEVDTPDTTTYQDDAAVEEVVPTAEELDGAIEEALLAHAKKRDSYDKVAKGRNKNKEAILQRLAKDVEETAKAVLDAMQVAAQYEYANTETIRHKLEQANGKNVVDAVRCILP